MKDRDRDIKFGVIGYGSRIAMVEDTMRKLSTGIKIVAITDPNVATVKKRLGLCNLDPDEIKFYGNADEMMDAEKLDGVLVGTRCPLHAPYAIKVLERNLPLFLEKPVATSMEQLLALRDAHARSRSEVVVSFPLRVTPLAECAKEIIDSGSIGTVEHVQAWNNVPYGWVYFLDWYRDESETQGMWLQKATHDFDYINYLLGLKPVSICAMTSKQIYKGDKPAGLRCEECDKWTSCMESPRHLFSDGVEPDDIFGPNGGMCGFAVDTGNEDSGSAIIGYESGMHVSYSQNLIARRGAGARGARFFGYKGTLEFDWYTSEVKVFMHHTPRVESYKIDTSAETHDGGDTVIADSFLRVIRDGAKSIASLDDGLLSVLMCLKAKESATNHTFQDITYPCARECLSPHLRV